MTRAQLLAIGIPDQHKAARFTVLAGLIWPLQAAVVAWAIGALLQQTGVFPSHAAPLAPRTPFQMTAGLAAGLFAAAGLLRVALTYASEAAATAGARAVIANIRTIIVQTEAKRGDESRFGGAGSVAALAGEKLDLLAPFVSRYTPAMARVKTLPILLLAVVFWQSWAVGIVLLVAGPLIPVFMALVGMAAKDASARQMSEIGSLNDLLIERLAALTDIRLLGAQEAVLTAFADQATDLRTRTMAVLRIAFLSSTVLELFAAIGVAMVAVFVGFSLLGAITFGTWGDPLTPQTGVFLLLIAPEFFQPLRDLSAAWHDKAAAEAVLDELIVWQEDIGQGDIHGRLMGDGGPAAPLAGESHISLRGCVTRSGRSLPDIDIAPGERIALIGGSGAGKTTVLRLIAGLEAASSGSVTVAGRPLTAQTADAWRARLGWMPQAPHFLNARLDDTITLGRTGGTDDLAAALTAAAVDKVVAGLPRGLATRLGETGGGLSGGEARRMTLARAVYGAPDVILADEPTADLESETAALVTQGLLAQSSRSHQASRSHQTARSYQGATLIIATHDPDLAAKMDRIIDLGDAT